MDTNTGATNSYFNVEDAAQVDLTPGQRWELHPNEKLSVDVRDNSGYIIETIELNPDSIITELTIEDPTTGEYFITANVDGQNYSLQTTLDYDTQVRINK